MTIIYLLRHGEYKNPKKIVPFRLPGFALSQKGKNQIKKIAKDLADKNITAFYSSPILRCKQTAKIIGRALKIKPQFSNLLIEVKTPYQGMDIKKFKAKTEDMFIGPFHLKNNGETIKKVFLRANKFLNKVFKKHKNKNVLIVSHGDVLMTLIYALVEKDINKYFEKTKDYIPKAGLAKLEFEGKKLKNFKQINY